MKSGKKAGRWTLGVLIAVTVVAGLAMSSTTGAGPADQASAAASASGMAMGVDSFSFQMKIEETGRTSDWIDVESWSWGVSNTGSGGAGGGGGAGKASFSDMSVTKELDKMSTKLMLACANGMHFKSVTILMNKATNKGNETYLTIKLVDVLVTSYQTGGSSGDMIPTESVSFAYAQIHIDWSGPGDEGPEEFGWDLVENKKV